MMMMMVLRSHLLPTDSASNHVEDSQLSATADLLRGCIYSIQIAGAAAKSLTNL